MTWVTLAAAVASALVVAAIDSGWPDGWRSGVGATDARLATGGITNGRQAPVAGTDAGRDGSNRGSALQH